MKSFLALFIFIFSSLVHAQAMTCISQMSGGYRLFPDFGSEGVFQSRHECRRAIRNSGNDLICLNGNRFDYSLFQISSGQILSSNYYHFEDCVASIKEAKKGHVCADSKRHGEWQTYLTRIRDLRSWKVYDNRRDCLSFLNQL